ncbi:zinc finger C-x8-C-x5-C-x3-H type family protein [Actinidia rufa]|uniref:Zinc finger C-x8-C-x5-C-x3-H type family protein n=1 Tax=Actinidia rufa TaxID=165716 RepID=A0A7J0H7T1_9ERIC|nr:zinc finger C-x8-C-x5-C-x3-H type family protein [Actinidia rufa]
MESRKPIENAAQGIKFNTSDRGVRREDYSRNAVADMSSQKRWGNLAVWNQQLINEEFQNQETVREKLQNPQVVNEELQNLFFEKVNEKGVDGEDVVEGAESEANLKVLEEKEKVSNKGRDNEEDVEGADSVVRESEANEKGTDCEVDVEGEDRNENDAIKGEEGIDYDNDDDDVENRSENENEDDNVNVNVGGEIVLVAGLKDGRYRRYHHPVRSDAEDCSYYMRTGTCKFGLNCKFNHPPRRKNQVAQEKVKENEGNPERPGQTECKVFTCVNIHLHVS